MRAYCFRYNPSSDDFITIVSDDGGELGNLSAFVSKVIKRNVFKTISVGYAKTSKELWRRLRDKVPELPVNYDKKIFEELGE